MTSHRQTNEEGSTEPMTQQDMIWKTLRGKPPKIQILGKYVQNIEKDSQQKHVQNLEKENR